MIGEFNFYNVGQGCFYVGRITYKDKEFVMVYDCGSVTKGTYLNDSINDFKKKFNRIDLLIVSHFDSDHFNGISKLIKGLYVKRIILPYLPLIKRLTLLSKVNNLDEMSISFLSNPAQFFSSGNFEIGYISFIKPTSNDNEKNVTEEDEEFNPDDLGEFELNGFEKDEEFRQAALIEEPYLSDISRLEFLKSNLNLRLANNFWKFIFYHRKSKNEKDISDFQEAVKKHIKHKGITMVDMFKDSNRSLLQDFYRKHINKNLNYTSICMFHIPLIKQEHVFLRENSNSICFRISDMNRGTMLTGDQFLKSQKDFDLFVNYFGKYLNDVLVFQVPHHGSNANWYPMPNILNKAKNMSFVINYGFGRKKHPHRSVLDNILTHTNNSILLNNEFVNVKYFIV